MRIILLILGLLFTGAGIVGVFVPILPAIPFFIVAVWCFARSSPKLHSWLLNLKIVGPTLRNWEEHGSIGKKTKTVAVITIIVSFSTSLVFFLSDITARILFTLLGILVIAFILTRPTSPKD